MKRLEDGCSEDVLTMKVAVRSPDGAAVDAVRQLLSPWHVEYVSPERADIVMAYKTFGEFGKTSVLVPSWSIIRQV